MLNEATLNEYKFAKWGTICTVGKRLRFKCDPPVVPSDKRGFVYLWTRAHGGGQELECCYVGKAGKLLADRWAQHEGGFVRSVSGLRLARHIEDCIRNGDRIDAWVKHSAEESIHGVTVSRCTLEELAFIGLFKPKWNRFLHT